MKFWKLTEALKNLIPYNLLSLNPVSCYNMYVLCHIAILIF